MVQVFPAHTISLATLERDFGLRKVHGTESLTQWELDFMFGQEQSQLTEAEEFEVEKIRKGYLNQKRSIRRSFTETMVHDSIVDPLLWLCGFYSEPFHVEPEVPISYYLPSIKHESPAAPVVGAIDKLVFHQNQWVLPIEVKRPLRPRFYHEDLSRAKAQLLSYMLGNPSVQNISYGIITNGNHFDVIKLFKIAPDNEDPNYIYYREFSAGTSSNPKALNPVYQFLNYIKSLALENYGLQQLLP